MTVIAIDKDLERLSLAITAEFDASPERVWQLWADPRQLERWWGPPTYPATFDSHDLTPGSYVAYHMTGPTGDQPRGYWKITKVEPPHRLEFRDGFAKDDGSPNPEFPEGLVIVSIDAMADGKTRMVIDNTSPSQEALEQVLAMGMEEGLREAVGQIDAILAGDPVHA